MEIVTHNNMPEIIGRLYAKVEQVENLLSKQEVPQPQKKYLQAQPSADFLGISLATFYSKASRGQLPVMKRNGKLYCLEFDLMDYLEQGRRKTNVEIQNEAMGGRK
ncbi:MAG: helix-turn-helix domain-containing protein [Salinivirgaceae bacterium]|jgi:hypothetical protein|nr:helix-turn-helix domain-containing protein [Salinivirgaceae bacterium]